MNGSPIPPYPNNIALFDDVGMGKTVQSVNAAQFLFAAGEIDIAVVAAPARVRGEWDDQVTGQVHQFMFQEYSICRIEKNHPIICECRKSERYLRWFVLSYPFLRSERHLETFVRSIAGKKFILFCDESSHIKNRSAVQTRGVKKLADWAKKIVILNGTPITQDITDLWSQMHILDPESVRRRNFFQFRMHFAKMGGYMMKNVVGVQNGEELKDMMKPWILRRERANTPGVSQREYSTIPVEMSDALYALYTDMRKNMIAWLDSDMAVASHAGVKALRLAQLTSGFLGGIVDLECIKCSLPEEEHESNEEACGEFIGRKVPPRDVDDSKPRAILQFIEDNPDTRMIIWCRFTAEIERLYRMMTAKNLKTSLIYGGISGKQAEYDLNNFKLGKTDYLIGQPQAGSEGLNLQQRISALGIMGGARVQVFCSNDYNWKTRYQAEGRSRPSPENPCLYVDVVMTTPKGKATIDHAIRKKLLSKEELAKWTVEEWRKVLSEE